MRTTNSRCRGGWSACKRAKPVSARALALPFSRRPGAASPAFAAVSRLSPVPLSDDDGGACYQRRSRLVRQLCSLFRFWLFSEMQSMRGDERQRTAWRAFATRRAARRARLKTTHTAIEIDNPAARLLLDSRFQKKTHDIFSAYFKLLAMEFSCLNKGRVQDRSAKHYAVL